MTEREELKPCPFCGEKAQHYRHSNAKSDWVGFLQNFDDHWISCTADDCCGNMGYYETKEQAINSWNRRAER